jgi:hypothetical protein
MNMSWRFVPLLAALILASFGAKAEELRLHEGGASNHNAGQPPGHPIPIAECDRITREDQQRLGLPVTGLSDELKATYRATWGQ